jgi:hypothetical protein
MYFGEELASTVCSFFSDTVHIVGRQIVKISKQQVQLVKCMRA